MFFEADSKIFVGTTSTKNCKGPLLSTNKASLIFKSALEEYFSLNSVFLSLEKLFPGPTKLTKPNPMLTDKTVEKRYSIIDLDPILDNLEMSDKDATPLISEANTKGTAISFNKLTKITPKGFIQSFVKLFKLR